MTHFTTSQKLYMLIVKRPIEFLGALVALIMLSPVFLATMGRNSILQEMHIEWRNHLMNSGLLTLVQWGIATT